MKIVFLMKIAVLGLVGWSASTSFAAEKPRVIEDSIPKTIARWEMVKLPGGKVTIKDKDGKEKEVEVKPFAIGKTEVTWDLYDVYWMGLDLPTAKERLKIIEAKSRGSRPYSDATRGWGREGCPAGSIHPLEAPRFVEWLKKTTGKKYRYATEAEWMYAARAGGKEKISEDKLDKVAWFDRNADDKTHPVATLEPNGFGLYDMLGNVAEYVMTEEGTLVIKGGGFIHDSETLINLDWKEAFNKKWQTLDCQDPKGKSWLSDGAHIGLRLVLDE